MSQYITYSLEKRTIGLSCTLCNVFNMRHCTDVNGTTTFRDLGKIDLYPIELGNEKKIVKSFVNSFVIDEENTMEEFNFTITVTKNNDDIKFSVIARSAFLKKQIYNNFSISLWELKNIATRDESYSLSTTHLPIVNLYNLGYARGCKETRAEMNDYCNYLMQSYNNVVQSHNELLVKMNDNQYYYESVIEEMELELQESNNKLKEAEDKLQESIGKQKETEVKLQETATECNNRLNELLNQEERICSVNETNRKLSDELNELKTDNEKLSIELEQYNNEIQDLLYEIQGFESYNEKLNLELKLSKANNQRLSDESNRFKNDNQRLSAELNRFKNDNQRLSAELEQFKADNQRLSAELEQFKANNQRLSAELERKNGEYEALLAKSSSDNNKLYEDESNNENITQPQLVQQFCPPEFPPQFPQEVNHFHQAMPMHLINKILNQFFNFLNNPTNRNKEIIEFERPNVGQSMFSLHIFKDCLFRSDPRFTENNMDVKYNSRDRILNITFRK